MSEIATDPPAPPSRVEALATRVESACGARVKRVASIAGELTYEVAPADLLSVCTQLRDDPTLAFDMLADVSGIDYLTYGSDEWDTHTATSSGFSRGVTAPDERAEAPAARRFAVAYHLLSMVHNARVRLRVHCEGSEPPMVDSVFGILFRGHPDLRRILTDYGFIGHPFRKDFPLIGHVEVRYDPDKQRVVYEPVSIEPRIQVPRVIRDDHRYEPALNGRASGLPGQKNG